MNDRMRTFIKNFSYTLSSNLITLIVSTVVILIIPKLIGIEDYGNWQLYLFYSLYVGIMHFGWNDGIYLRYGGAEYSRLDKRLFFSQFMMLVGSQLFIMALAFVSYLTFGITGDRLFILKMVSIVLVLVNVRGMLYYILQATNELKRYAQIVMLDRIIYVTLLVIFLLIGVRNYKFMIVADLIGIFLSLVYAMYCCKEIVFNHIGKFYFSFKEMIENIHVGIKLMFANIANILIIGSVRFGVERSWDVETFGKISLTLSISNMFMLFINALGVVMFPMLKRTEEKNLSAIYVTLRDLLLVTLGGVLLLYYPIKVIMSAWLTQYADSLKYMALLFPLFIYEGKMSLLVNTYLRTLRKERAILVINIITTSISLMLTILTTQVLKSLNLAVFTIILLLAFRSVIAEIYLSKVLKISLIKDIVIELCLSVTFIASGWFINSWYTSIVYGMSYAVFLLIKRNDIKNIAVRFRLYAKN